jgi:hypothetical protein
MIMSGQGEITLQTILHVVETLVAAYILGVGGFALKAFKTKTF